MVTISDNIPLSGLLATPAISPSIGGWDALLNAQLDDLRSRFNHGLLARLVAFDPDSSGTNVLFVVPAGFSAILTQILILKNTVVPSGTTRRYTVGHTSGTPTEWHSSGFSIENLDADGDALVVYPFPGADPFVATIAVALPIFDGDGATATCYIDLSVGTGVNGGMHWFMFGHVWPNG